MWFYMKYVSCSILMKFLPTTAEFHIKYIVKNYSDRTFFARLCICDKTTNINSNHDIDCIYNINMWKHVVLYEICIVKKIQWLITFLRLCMFWQCSSLCTNWPGKKCLDSCISNSGTEDDKNRHFVLLIIDISKDGAKEMGHVKMAGPGFVKDVTAWWPGFVQKKNYEKTGTKATEIHSHHCLYCDTTLTFNISEPWFSVECFITSSNRTNVVLQ
jgi:hypothetical protein